MRSLTRQLNALCPCYERCVSFIHSVLMLVLTITVIGRHEAFAGTAEISVFDMATLHPLRPSASCGFFARKCIFTHTNIAKRAKIGDLQSYETRAAAGSAFIIDYTYGQPYMSSRRGTGLTYFASDLKKQRWKRSDGPERTNVENDRTSPVLHVAVSCSSCFGAVGDSGTGNNVDQSAGQLLYSLSNFLVHAVLSL